MPGFHSHKGPCFKSNDFAGRIRFSSNSCHPESFRRRTQNDIWNKAPQGERRNSFSLDGGKLEPALSEGQGMRVIGYELTAQ